MADTADRRTAAKRFENDRVWERVGSDMQYRLAATVALAPRDARSLLEVGCGDGQVAFALRDALGHDVQAVGVDRARTGLRRFRAAGGIGLACDADTLPFADQSFDLVLSCQVLEHLPEAVFAGAVRELARVTRRDLLVSVPDREDLRRDLMACPRCGASFNAYGHLRRFDVARLDALFPGFVRCACRTAGPRRGYDARLLRLRHALGRHRWEPTAVCPNCGNRRFPDRELDPLRLLLDAANFLLHPFATHDYWLLARYRCV